MTIASHSDQNIFLKNVNTWLVYSKKKLNGSGTTFFIAICLTFLFILQQPRFSLLFFPHKKNVEVARFITDTIASQNFSLDSWWKLRDIQANSVITYNPTYLQPFSLLQFSKLDPSQSKLFYFHGQQIKSEESVISSDLKKKLEAAPLEGTIVFSNRATLISYDEDKQLYHVRSIQPISVMKTTNGLIDFQGSEKILNEKWWLLEGDLSVLK